MVLRTLKTESQAPRGYYALRVPKPIEKGFTMFYQTAPTSMEDAYAKEAIRRLSPSVKRQLVKYRECLRALVLYSESYEVRLTEVHVTLDGVLLRESWQAWEASSDGYDYPPAFRGEKKVVVDALLQAAQTALAQAYKDAFWYGEDALQSQDILTVSEWIAACEFGGYLHWEY